MMSELDTHTLSSMALYIQLTIRFGMNTILQTTGVADAELNKRMSLLTKNKAIR
jgi:hypothetical protein